jgi:hypothetical protein
LPTNTVNKPFIPTYENLHVFYTLAAEIHIVKPFYRGRKLFCNIPFPCVVTLKTANQQVRKTTKMRSGYGGSYGKENRYGQ